MRSQRSASVKSWGTPQGGDGSVAFVGVESALEGVGLVRRRRLCRCRSAARRNEKDYRETTSRDLDTSCCTADAVDRKRLGVNDLKSMARPLPERVPPGLGRTEAKDEERMKPSAGGHTALPESGGCPEATDDTVVRVLRRPCRRRRSGKRSAIRPRPAACRRDLGRVVAGSLWLDRRCRRGCHLHRAGAPWPGAAAQRGRAAASRRRGGLSGPPRRGVQRLLVEHRVARLAGTIRVGSARGVP